MIDQILTHGRIHTLAEQGVVEALAIHSGRVVATGSNADVERLGQFGSL